MSNIADSKDEPFIEANHQTQLESNSNMGTKESKDDLPEESANLAPVRTPWYKFDGFDIAQGYNLNGMGRGPMVMSNVFLSTAFIFLAQKQAGCIDEDEEVIEDCNGKAYGFDPISIVTNIAVIAGVLSALFMPLIGAMVDYTSHRRTVGIVSCVVMIVIQAAQIATGEKTWLTMAILQAIAGFLYQSHILAIYAYLPDMSYIVGEDTMVGYTKIFVQTQFSSQSLFLIVVIGISVAFGFDDVVTAQVGQGIDVLISGWLFYWSWTTLPHVPPRHELPEGHSLLTEGFSQIFKTAKDINANYKRGTRWFFLALVFAEAGANAFTTVAVVFLDDELGMTGTEIGVFFLITLVFSVPGASVGAWVTERTDPKRSWQLNLFVLCVWSAGGAFFLASLPSYLSFVWGAGVGVCLGWFYPVENVFFSMCLPKGQEAELSGFFVYCSQILVWLPPLIFSVLVEANVSQPIGVAAVASFLLIAIAIVQCSDDWEGILVDSGRAAPPPQPSTENTPTDAV